MSSLTLGSNTIKFELEQRAALSGSDLTDIARYDLAIKRVIKMPFVNELLSQSR